MIIKLVRHGQSQANTGEVLAHEIGDHTVELTALGHDQARAAGHLIGAEFVSQAMIYRSPFRRTRQTLESLIAGSGVPRESLRVYEDPRLREVDGGYVGREPQAELRRVHGWFYYRFQGGESPADCYDRTSTFLESLMRQAKRKDAERILIVTHGITIRCFAMRFFHLSVEQFESIDLLDNCGIVTIGPTEVIDRPQFTSGRWAVAGLKLREPGEG
jgi:broad specificity phosphatase PhoE